MSLLRAIAIVLLLALCLPVLGITSSPTATSVQTTPAVVSLPAAASLANPAAVAATTAAFARPMPVAAAPAPAAKPAAVTTGSKTTSAAAASSHAPVAAKPPRTEHAALTPQQPAAPQRIAARTPPAPAPVPAQHALPPAAKPQQHTTKPDEPRPPKAYVNTRSHWLPKTPAPSREAARAPSRDRKDKQTSSVQRDRTAPPPPPDRTASRPGYRDDGWRYTPPPSRTASRYDDMRDDRRSYSSNAPRDVAPRSGYRQSQEHGRRDSQTRISESRRKALLREYRETARRQSEIERQLGGSYSGRASARRDRYSDASGGRQ